jgi:hypothetical protein
MRLRTTGILRVRCAKRTLHIVTCHGQDARGTGLGGTTKVADVTGNAAEGDLQLQGNLFPQEHETGDAVLFSR